MLLYICVKLLNLIQILQNKSHISAIIVFLMKNIFLQIKHIISFDLV